MSGTLRNVYAAAHVLQILQRGTTAGTAKFWENEIWPHPYCRAHNLKMADAICKIQIAISGWYIALLVNHMLEPYICLVINNQNVTVSELLWPVSNY